MKKVLFLVAMLALVAAPAGAFWFGGSTTNDSSITVDNYDFAKVSNDVYTKADTGDNEVEENSGNVLLGTGDALATTYLGNQVNYIDTSIVDGCGCLQGVSNGFGSTLNDSSISVKNVKKAFVGNDVATKAETGDNEIEDNGGTYTYNLNKSGHSFSKDSGWFGHSFDHSSWSYSKNVTKPMGGDVTVLTGNAMSGTEIENVVNTDLTTIIRGVELPN